MATPKKEAQSVQASLKYQREKDSQPVRGKFIFHEVPGGAVSFNYKKYKEDDVQRYDMVDGEIYTIPLGVAKHLNKNCSYPIHSFILDEYGRPTQKIGQMVRRMSFQSLEFIDNEDLTPVGSSLVTVQNVL
jgi:hypothetical protein